MVNLKSFIDFEFKLIDYKELSGFDIEETKNLKNKKINLEKSAVNYSLLSLKITTAIL